jgi:chromosome partitioning protein
MRVMALVNQKGGCGKTTTAVNLASRFAARGLRTVLLDLDPQGHATMASGAPAPEPGKSLAAVLSASGLEESAVPLTSILIPLTGGPHLGPSGAELVDLEERLARAAGGEERLAEHLARLSDSFDRVVVDAPPSLGLLTLNALTAAHEAIVPVEPSLFAMHGLARLMELTRLLESRNGHQLRIRILVNAYDGRTCFHRQTLEEIRRSFPEETLETVVRASVRVREAAARSRPVDQYAPDAPIVQDYEALATELERKEASAAVQDLRRHAPGLVVTREGLYLTRRDVPPDRVRLAGDFNAWAPDSGVLLEVREDGGWTKFLPLKPGRYEYRLVVDGHWQADPLNPKRVPNNMGSVNSVLEVEA